MNIWGDFSKRGRPSVPRPRSTPNVEGTRVLEHPPAPPAAPPGAFGVQPLVEGRGSVIGPYKLIEQIGEGGMGVVFMAEQTKPVQRRVALKIIKAGMDTREVVARFEVERQALALMDHPNIARVLDAGATDTGRPYFVMELVRGVPMTEFCNQQSLSIRDRLALFVTVCQAVQHAHQKGIIHRDIKPNNVLVTLHDGHPTIKVIDFGVAKATGQKLTDKTLVTGFTQMIGTPLYMSPEQAEMTSQDIDTRSDIFSTGVLLYELLTGTTPVRQPAPRSRLVRRVAADHSRGGAASAEHPAYNSDGRGGLHRLQRAEERPAAIEPPIPWRTRLDRDEMPGKGPHPPLRNGQRPGRRRRALLARRTGPCLPPVGPLSVRQIRPAEQGRTAHHRGRDGRARSGYGGKRVASPSRHYRGSAVQGQRASGNIAAQASGRDREATREPARSPDPSRDGRTITVAELLDRSAKELQGKFADDPVTKAKMLQAIGQSYSALGLYREAIPLLEQARDLFLGASGRENSDTLDAMSCLAYAYHGAGRIADELPLCEESLTIQKAKFGPEHLDTAKAMDRLAMAYGDAGRNAEALRLEKESLKTYKAALGPDNPRTIMVMVQLANLYREVGRTDDAVRLLEETLKLQKSKRGPNHRDTVALMSNLAAAYTYAGRNAEALPLHEETLRIYKATLGPQHPDTLAAMLNVTSAYLVAGRTDDAIRLGEETLKLMKAKLGSDHPNTLQMMGVLAIAYQRGGRTDDAIRLGEETLASSAEFVGEFWLGKGAEGVI